MAQVAVIGSGYVGTVVAACLAHIGHEVVGVEADPDKVEVLLAGRAPFYEPGLDHLIDAGLRSGVLSFTTDMAGALRRSHVVFICVGTPAGVDGRPDMTAMQAVSAALADASDRPHVIVTKSTVPIGTGHWLSATIRDRIGGAAAASVSVVSNPEFLREGCAVEDFLHPERVVLGSEDADALDAVEAVYRPILDQRVFDGNQTRTPAPLIRTTTATAEMIKYSSNAFLATKISFANEIGRICDFVGADVSDVTAGMGLDSRIGPHFLGAGLGWGGSCFGKDLAALIATSAEYGYEPEILRAAVSVNRNQRHVALRLLLQELKTLRGARVCMLGLSFKPETDDVRDAPALDIARLLTDKGAFVTGYDPRIADDPDGAEGPWSFVRLAGSPYAAAEGADAILISTEWSEIVGVDLVELRRRTAGALLIDGRNCLQPEAVCLAGFDYVGIGRGGPRRGQPLLSSLVPERSL